MNPRDIAIHKQIIWATKEGLVLERPSAGSLHENYVHELDDNFHLRPSDKTMAEFREAAGQELSGKMKALHSSSALAVNVFEFWRHRIESVAILARSLRIPSKQIESLQFEEKLPINEGFANAPHMDVLVGYADGSVCGIESKFTEHYSSKTQGLDPKYLNENEALWAQLPTLREFASENLETRVHSYFDSIQMLKHTMGLLSHTKDKSKLRIMYLWYDGGTGSNHSHRSEIDHFASVMTSDGITFYSLTYQEAMINLWKELPEHDKPGFRAYVNYLTDRYL